MTRRKHLTLCNVRDHFTLCIHGFVMPIQGTCSWGELKTPQSWLWANRIPITKIQIVHRMTTFLSVATHNWDRCVDLIVDSRVESGERCTSGSGLRGGNNLFLLISTQVGARRTAASCSGGTEPRSWNVSDSSRVTQGIGLQFFEVLHIEVYCWSGGDTIVWTGTCERQVVGLFLFKIQSRSNSHCTCTAVYGKFVTASTR